MNLVLRGLTWKTVLAFLDDKLVLGPSFDEHLTNLQNVFARFREYGLRLKPKKCALFRTNVEFLGRSVSNQGLQIGQQHLQPTLKDNLLSAPVLTLPNNKDYFILDADASQHAIGAELIQVQDGEERTITYGSFVLTAEQKRYCTTRK
ncbi:Hypothetical predicted protein [Mytilus galloprovincialis]|uniref:Reverse transcriptase domain-containing protein n=1 Tax=Mytilus galloprovincialis TaxID=29158 RepID=A0A8B6G2K9_MYTGA|nr:Hypothetical predicted protein [Mytilus galloprovincialis]